MQKMLQTMLMRLVSLSTAGSTIIFMILRTLNPHESAPPSAIDKTYGPMTKHFAKDDQSQEDISIQIVEHIKLPPHSKTYRECFWMQQLKSVQPLGINSMEVSKWLLARK